MSILQKYTNIELLEELLRREGGPKLPVRPDLEITPYKIMMKMIEQGWKEDPRPGYSDPRISKIWAYLGYPNFNDDQSYCAATVNACLKLAGFKTSGTIPVARSFEYYGKVAPHPAQGDIVIFKTKANSWKGHVGFLKELIVPEGYTDKATYKLAGGNQDNKMCLKEYKTTTTTMVLSCIRRITEECRIGKPDLETLKEWKLI